MTFGSRHYMPVLKVKRGEKKALRAIASAFHQHIVPLMEIVERSGEKPIDQHLDTAFDDLAESLRPYPRFLLDTKEIAVDGPAAAADVYARAVTAGMKFTPVTGVSREADVAAALTHRTNGIAVRLTREEFERGVLAPRLTAFLTEHDLAPSEIDLVIDLGALDDLIAEGVANLTAEFLAVVPHQTQWRTLTVSGCAFPRSMGIVDRHSHGLRERAGWKAWRDTLHASRQDLQRLPTFGDCAIQHPLGVEGFDFRTMQVSAAVRYCLPEDWLLIKGEGTRKLLPSVQFPRLAKRLVSGNLMSYFAGAGHCAGCAGISAAAKGAAGYGSAEAWRRLGTIHHVTTVLEGLTSLPWP